MKIGDILIFVYTKEPRYKIIDIKETEILLLDIKFSTNTFWINEQHIKEDIKHGFYFISKQYLFNEQLQELIDEI